MKQNTGEEPIVSEKMVCPFMDGNWTPAPYRQVSEMEHREKLSTDGYFIIKGFFSESTIARLNELYRSWDHVGANDIGMFMSAYSQDIPYRKAMHHGIEEIVNEPLQKVFCNFKPMVYNFVIKQSRPEHELPMHQDLALVDERYSSPINIWISMMDVSTESGPVCVIPKTQYLFPPNRSKYSDEAVGNISDFLRPYAVEVPLEAGDLLVFDSRLIHFSLPNHSGKDRMAAVCYIYPDDAPFQMTVKAMDGDEDEFDILKFERDDLFTNAGFETVDKTGFKGNVIERVKLTQYEITEKQCTDYFQAVDVPIINPPESSFTATAAPSKNDSMMKRLKNLVSGFFN